MGMVSGAVTLAWVSGSAMSGIIATVHPAAPTILAVSLYAIDAIFVVAVLPADKPAGGKETLVNAGKPSDKSSGDHDDAGGKAGKGKRPGFFLAFKQTFNNGLVARVVAVRLAYALITRASGSLQINWEQERFGLTMAKMGMVNTTKSVISIMLQTFVIGRVIRVLGERLALTIAIALSVLGHVFEAVILDTTTYMVVCSPVKLLAGFLADLGLKSLFTQVRLQPPCPDAFFGLSKPPSPPMRAVRCAQVVPQDNMGSALAVLDVISSAVGVVAPLLGGLVVQYGGLLAKPIAAGSGHALLLLALLAGALPKGVQGEVTSETADGSKSKSE